MKPHHIALALLYTTLPLAAQDHPTYSGKTTWDPTTATLTFTTSGAMPGSKEGFFWQVPPSIKHIHVGPDVTVQGGFRIAYRPADNPLHITGADRASSVITGTESRAWTTANEVPENDKWKYGSVSVLADATVHIRRLTLKNPRGYNISGYADKSVIHVDDCALLDTRGGDNNNSDGFIGSAGSSVRNTFISTRDDAIKVYHDITIEDVTIEHHRNGAPLQFGWGGENTHATAKIKNLKIIGAEPDGLYNMAPFTWEAGTSGRRTVHIDGLEVHLPGKLYDEPSTSWQPAALFELKPETCTLDFTAENATLHDLPTGLVNTRGTITINGTPISKP